MLRELMANLVNEGSRPYELVILATLRMIEYGSFRVIEKRLKGCSRHSINLE